MSFSVLILVVLLARGWGSGAWTIAAAGLAVSCAAICVWLVVLAGSSARAQERAARELAEARRSAGRSPQERTLH